MKFLFICITALVLTACGKDETVSSSGGEIGGGQSPQVSVPANAIVSDYKCTDTEEYENQSGAMITENFNYSGTTFEWKEGQENLLYSEEATYKMLSRSTKHSLSESQYRILSTISSWYLENGAWKKTDHSYDRIWLKEENGRRNVSNKEDGVDKPYFWRQEFFSINDKIERTVNYHLNPSVRDGDGRHYVRITSECVDTYR